MKSGASGGEGADVSVAEPLSDSQVVPIEMLDEVEHVAVRPSRPPPPPERRVTRSIPPPFPGERRRRPTRIELPRPAPPGSVVERARAQVLDLTTKARADQLSRQLERAALGDPEVAARLAYELGELYERGLGDEERALRAYRRGFALAPGLRANAWALRRMLYDRAAWPELLQRIDTELGRAADDHERVELWCERAVVAGHQGADDEAVRALDAALAIAPLHLGALLERERLAARARDATSLVAQWEQLAAATTLPERAILYRLALARELAPREPERARDAIARAAQLVADSPVSARGRLAEQVARERLRIAAVHGTAAEQVTALEALAQLPVVLAWPGTDEHPHRAAARRAELVALRRRQAKLVRGEAPARAWEYLLEARTLDPDEPVLVTELVELASELAREDELPELIASWYDLESEEGRANMLAWWCADAQLHPERRAARRTLVAALASLAPGFLLVVSAAECEDLGDAARVRAQLDLATTYEHAAKAALDGTWSGPWSPPRPDARAAAAFHVQAAHLFGTYVATPAAHDQALVQALVQAREALSHALTAVPDYPPALEAAIELADRTGRVDDAVQRLRAFPGDAGAALARAIRIAHGHDRTDAVLELQRDLAARTPDDRALAWQLEATLARLGHHDERVALLRRLAHDDPEPARRRTALVTAARACETAGELAAACELYGELAAACADDAMPHDARIELLRAQARWADLAAARRDEARAAGDDALARRAWREAAFLLEVRLEDVGAAAEIYDEWLARVPDDRTALEGLARCRNAQGDAGREVAPRARIAELDDTPDARWRHADCLERAGQTEAAIEAYRAVVTAEGAPVASVVAALALGDLAGKAADLPGYIQATDALARRTADAGFGAALFEDCGWMCAVAVEEIEWAAESFASALELQPARAGALLGSALVAACRADPERLAQAYVRLASVVGDKALAAALWLRVAAIAAADGEPELASERIEAARAAAPDHAGALVVSAEIDPGKLPATRDPFAAADRLLARAELIERRAALVEDPLLRASWELDRAEALELAGQPSQAAGVLASVLAVVPDDWRALWALRRIAEHAHQDALRAQACYALARASRDRELRLRMLREAAEIYDRPGPGRQPAFALAVYRRILEIDPGAPELEPLLAILRERDDRPRMIAAITARLDHLVATAGTAAAGDPQLVALLVERSTLLRDLDRRAEASADLDAVLEHAPDHLDAIRLRADLAVLAGDLPRATALWRRYLALETSAPRRAEIEALLAVRERTGAGGRDVEPTTAVHVVEPPGAETWESEATRPAAPAHAGAPAVDPFGGTTLVVDISALQEQERALARAADEQASTTSPTVVAPAEPEHPIEPGPSASLTLRLPVIELAAVLAAPAGTDTGPAELEPVLDLASPWADADELPSDDSAVVMLPFDQLRPSSREALSTDVRAQVERELAAAAGGPGAAALHLEAGRLAELAGELEAARVHYEAALLADARATAALRGLRRIARAGGELAEVARLLEAELPLASPAERGPLLRHRLDLLMALGEQDLARVAAGELLDASSQDVPALLAHLELAFLDARADEFGKALELLAGAVSEPALRAAAQAARAILGVSAGELEAAATWFSAASATDREALALRLDALRFSRAAEGTRAALLQLAYQVEAGDPTAAAALAVRVPAWPPPADGGAETLAAAVQLATGAAARDPVVVRLAARVALGAEDREAASHVLARLARCSPAPAERAHAAARAAELDPGRLARLWGQVLELDPGDDHAAAQLRACHVAAGHPRQAIELDLQLARDTGREVPRLRAAAALLAIGDPDQAIAELAQARELHPRSLATIDALAAAFARAGRWKDRAALLGEVAADPGPFAGDVARLAAALAFEQAARALASAGTAPRADLERAAIAALDAWDLVIADDPDAAVAHGAAIHLAAYLDDPAILVEVLARAEAAERSPWAASSLALRRARLAARTDPRFAYELARDSAPDLDDPRRTLDVMMAAARCGEVGEIATALETRADRLEVAAGDAASTEVAALRLRAGLLALEAGEAARAAELLARTTAGLPGVADDALEVAHRRAGTPPPPPAVVRRESFVRVLRDAEEAEARGEHEAALARYQRALELRPGHAFASAPLVRLAFARGEPEPLAGFAFEQIRSAEATGDPIAKSQAYELLADVELLRGDASSALLALETASRADPGRIDLMHRLERELAARRQHGELLLLRERQIQLAAHSLGEPGAPAAPHDLAALVLDAASLAVRDRRSESKLADLYRTALDSDPRNRRALLQLERIVRRAGASERLVALDEQIAACLDDAPARSAFLLRAGEALAALGRGEQAVQRFARAAEIVPGDRFALDTWYQIALERELWLELAEVAMRKAKVAGDSRSAATLLHLAGVALADKARAPELAMAMLGRALDADPGHPDAFARLRALYEQTGRRDELAALLAAHSELEGEPGSRPPGAR